MQRKPSQRSLPASGEQPPERQETDLETILPGQRMDDLEQRLDKRRQVATDILEIVHELQEEIESLQERVDDLEEEIDR